MAFEGSASEEKWELKQVARSCGVRERDEIDPITVNNFFQEAYTYRNKKGFCGSKRIEGRDGGQIAWVEYACGLGDGGRVREGASEREWVSSREE